jgi:hypothetical protein
MKEKLWITNFKPLLGAGLQKLSIGSNIDRMSLQRSDRTELKKVYENTVH